MRKYSLVLIGCLLLTACHQSEQSSETIIKESSSSVKTSVQTEANNQPVSQEKEVEPSTEVRSVEMDTEAISGGDYTSLVGTWQNAKGSIIEIDAQGNLTYKEAPEATYYVDNRFAKIENGVLMMGITNPNAMASATVPTEFIPKGVAITHVAEGTDPTDQTRDRFFSTQAIMSADVLKDAVYYRLNEE